jgi:hypothetical protein
VSADRDTVLEEAPSLLGPEHVTEHPHISGFPPGPELLIGANEDVHTGDSPGVTADVCKHKDTHTLDSEAPSLQPPTPLELGPEEGPHMFASLFEVLSSFSPPSLSRSSSSSSTSSVPALSPDLQTQWGGDSRARSPNRSSSEEEFAPADLCSDDDVMYSPSEALDLGIRVSQGLDFFSMPGSFSEIDSFQPGTSAGTIRPLVNSIVSDGVSTPSDEDWPSTCGDYTTPEFDEADVFDECAENADEAVDGEGQENRNRRRAEGYEERQTSNGHQGGGRDWQQVNGSDSNGNGHGSAGGGHGSGGRDDRQEDERDRKLSSVFSTPSDTESEDSEEDSACPPAQRSQSEEGSTSGDDNVPLAQSIPTALRAQRTIRKQVRDEKDERRRQRALKRQQQQRQQIHKQTLLGEEHHAQRGPSLPQASSKPVSLSSRPTRSRTKTLPSNASRPIVAEDLARRLRDIQDLSVSPASFLNKQPLSSSDSAPHSGQVTQRSEGHVRILSVGTQDKSVRPMRSFHHLGTADSVREQPLLIPPLSHDTSRLGRRATSAPRPAGRHDQPETAVRAIPGSLSKSSRRPRTSDDADRPSTNTSVLQRVSLPRISTDVSDPSPALPAVSKETKQVSWQQRIFIIDLQRFNSIVMNSMTTAREVLDVLEAQGQLANWAGVGGWMLFEVSQDFGMGKYRSR